MTTKTFHDIHDLVDLVMMLENASIEITMSDGDMHFDVSNYNMDASGMPNETDHISIEGSRIQIRGFFENVDKAFRIAENKIVSGEWKKNDDCA